MHLKLQSELENLLPIKGLHRGVYKSQRFTKNKKVNIKSYENLLVCDVKKETSTTKSRHHTHPANTLLQMYTCRALYLNQNVTQRHETSFR